MRVIRQTLERAVSDALAALGAQDIPFVIERPASMEHGDYATNAALAAAKPLGKNPREIAQTLVEKLGAIEGVSNIEIAGAGFINFYLSREALTESLVSMHATTEATATGKTIMVEYTDPNPFKEFHIGHLMSNAIGESIARLLENVGNTVVRANYQGDVGPHVAKALYILLEKNTENPTIEDISKAYVEGAARYEDDPAQKAAIDGLNKTIYEKSDARVQSLYEKGRALSLEHFEELYRVLGTKFDHYFFESETGPRGLRIVKAHPEIFEESEGATIFRGESHGLHTRVFITKWGLPTYEAKDLGLAEAKKEKASFDSSVTVTANEQDAYFKVILKVLSLVHPEWDGAFQHVSHGMMRFAEGKMSSRKGNVITGESLLRDMEEAAMEKMQGRELKDEKTTAQHIAVGAIKYAILKQGSAKDIIFDPDKSLSLEGDSGPYVQYAHTRALSLLRAAKEANISASESDAPEHATVLERTLLHFSEAVSRAAKDLQPHHLAVYLAELAGAFNSWYASTRVIGGENPGYGVLLTEAVEKTLAEGLELLGIPVPEEM